MHTPSSLILKWFAFHKVRTIAQVKMACKSLALNYEIDPKRAFYYLFMPLVRMGMVEFIGRGRYHIAPSVLLQHENDECITAINPGSSVKAYIFENFEASEQLFNLVRFNCSATQLETIQQRYSIPIMKAAISGILTSFPSIKTVIENLEQIEFAHGNKLFFNPFSYEWNTQPSKFGICKESDSSRVYYFKDENLHFYKIPPAEINPEIFSIAACYQVALMQRPYLSYEPENQLLYVSNIRMPVLLERILRISSIHLCENWPTQGNEICLQCITSENYQSLQRILNLNP